jgi:hypothetical protein
MIDGFYSMLNTWGMGMGKRHGKSKLKVFETRTDTDNWITDFEMSRQDVRVAGK